MIASMTRFVLVLSFFSLSGCLEIGLPGLTGSGGDDESEAESESDDSDSSKGSSATTPGDESSPEEGSCDAWKISYCDAVAACESFADREECENDVGFLVCHPEAPIARCQKEIDAALDADECRELPGAECTPERVADRSYAVAACQAMHQEVCEWSLFCGIEQSYESCLANQDAADPCTEYFAVWPGIDPCLQGLSRLACNEPLPDVCRGIFRK